MTNGSKVNIIQHKSFTFALHVINLYKQITTHYKEYILTKQLLRSGTSIGANIEEAIGAQTKKDFLTKCTIAYKEARESAYWIKLLNSAHYISDADCQNIQSELQDILNILTAIQKTTRSNLHMK